MKYLQQTPLCTDILHSDPFLSVKIRAEPLKSHSELCRSIHSHADPFQARGKLLRDLSRNGAFQLGIVVENGLFRFLCHNTWFHFNNVRGQKNTTSDSRAPTPSPSQDGRPVAPCAATAERLARCSASRIW